jgi:hypothetical protein
MLGTTHNRREKWPKKYHIRRENDFKVLCNTLLGHRQSVQNLMASGNYVVLGFVSDFLPLFVFRPLKTYIKNLNKKMKKIEKN